MRELTSNEIKSVSGGTEPPLVMPTVTVTSTAGRQERIWELAGQSLSEYLGYDSIDWLQSLTPEQIQLTEPFGSVQDFWVEIPDVNPWLEVEVDPTNWVRALVLSDGWFDRNGNGLVDGNESQHTQGSIIFMELEELGTLETFRPFSPLIS